ncbi:hypothetical protein GCM10012288_03240 [Malaciobacter pacificus]|jgi:hypothetical protein|uniref:Uncharacterized protein n=1 Tax=Malaciobacter pacificus TaxID=1080223 RepID=A0A5C2H8B4_9BACT|nr:hypothetical protein [Malaciobacter pacificus]QEP33705.1 hypothetical protein APAC_0555 [Malaciobacter pacificus]GGD32654.1 hypothetical protein GCM10012288_03240 [Malaciobacter pacificus]
MPQNDPLSKLHDIKPLVEIPDNSFFIFLALVIFGLILLISIAFVLIRFFKNRKKSDRKRYFEILENIDFSNPKQSAYDITKYSRLLARNEREIRLCNDLIEDLEQYKYKKEVKDIDKSIQAKFSNFLDVIDV